MAATLKFGPRNEQILAVLNKHKGEKTVDELAEIVEMEPQSLRSALSKIKATLIKAGGDKRVDGKLVGEVLYSRIAPKEMARRGRSSNARAATDVIDSMFGDALADLLGKADGANDDAETETDDKEAA